MRADENPTDWATRNRMQMERIAALEAQLAEMSERLTSKGWKKVVEQRKQIAELEAENERLRAVAKSVRTALSTALRIEKRGGEWWEQLIAGCWYDLRKLEPREGEEGK